MVKNIKKFTPFGQHNACCRLAERAQNSITMHHQEQDARSLAMHTAAIELMRANDTLIQSDKT